MKQEDKIKVSKLHGIILSYMLRTQLEELGRNGYIVYKEKQQVNRVIKHLEYKEELFHQLDNEVPQEAIDTILNAIDDYIKLVGSVDIMQLPKYIEEFKLIINK